MSFVSNSNTPPRPMASNASNPSLGAVAGTGADNTLYGNTNNEHQCTNPDKKRRLTENGSSFDRLISNSMTSQPLATKETMIKEKITALLLREEIKAHYCPSDQFYYNGETFESLRSLFLIKMEDFIKESNTSNISPGMYYNLNQFLTFLMRNGNNLVACDYFPDYSAKVSYPDRSQCEQLRARFPDVSFNDVLTNNLYPFFNVSGCFREEPRLQTIYASIPYRVDENRIAVVGAVEGFEKESLSLRSFYLDSRDPDLLWRVLPCVTADSQHFSAQSETALSVNLQMFMNRLVSGLWIHELETTDSQCSAGEKIFYGIAPIDNSQEFRSRHSALSVPDAALGTDGEKQAFFEIEPDFTDYTQTFPVAMPQRDSPYLDACIFKSKARVADSGDFIPSLDFLFHYNNITRSAFLAQVTYSYSTPESDYGISSNNLTAVYADKREALERMATETIAIRKKDSFFV